ncbi:MAG: hypothetical protein IPM64_12110 [Phycisphaerales bacterium]|nr:hypothetical protein [Phycisphaerales bacterium]
MTLLIGLLLIAVFVVFATAMFLERLSALLALPLMAVCFVTLAATADALNSDNPRRIAWNELARQQDAIIGDKIRHSRAAVDALLIALGRDDGGGAAHVPPAERNELTQLRAAEQELRARTDALPNLVSRPPVHPGWRSAFADRMARIPGSARMQAVLRANDPHSNDAAGARAALEEIRREIEAATAGADEAKSGAGRATATSYVAEHLVLTLRGGALWMYATIIATLFGGMFAMYVRNLDLARRMVLWTAEFAGERPFVLTLAVFLATAAVFTSLGGLGTVIMLGTIILPILRSIGLSPIVSAGVFLIAISMGGTLYPVTRRLWMDLYGVPAPTLDRIIGVTVALYALLGIAWIWWGTRRGLLSSFCAVAAGGSPGGSNANAGAGTEGGSSAGANPNDRAGGTATAPPQERIPVPLAIAPLLPVALVYLAGIEEITAFTASIAYMFACVAWRPGSLRVLARSLVEGAQAVAPPCLLMIGIGMLYVALQTDAVQGYLRPLLEMVAPSRRLAYILTFSLAAPLALYRGPLNAWGMGTAVASTLLALGALPPEAVLAVIIGAGMLQGVCDPTNTANVWIAGFQGVTVNRILRFTLLPVWIAAAAAIVLFGLWFVPA